MHEMLRLIGGGRFNQSIETAAYPARLVFKTYLAYMIYLCNVCLVFPVLLNVHNNAFEEAFDALRDVA